MLLCIKGAGVVGGWAGEGWDMWAGVSAAEVLPAVGGWLKVWVAGWAGLVGRGVGSTSMFVGFGVCALVNLAL